MRQISLDAGLSPNALSGILVSSRVDARSLKQICKALGVPVIEGSVAAGFLDPDDVKLGIEAGEAELLRRVRLLPPRRRQAIVEVVEGLLSPVEV